MCMLKTILLANAEAGFGTQGCGAEGARPTYFQQTKRCLGIRALAAHMCFFLAYELLLPTCASLSKVLNSARCRPSETGNWRAKG